MTEKGGEAAIRMPIYKGNVKKSMKEDGGKEGEKKADNDIKPQYYPIPREKMVPNTALQALSSRYNPPPPSTSLVNETGKRIKRTERKHNTLLLVKTNILPSEEERLVSPFLCSKQHTKQPEIKRKRKKDREAVSQSPAHAPTMTTDPFYVPAPFCV